MIQLLKNSNSEKNVFAPNNHTIKGISYNCFTHVKLIVIVL
jgi:hypothetical protein